MTAVLVLDGKTAVAELAGEGNGDCLELLAGACVTGTEGLASDGDCGELAAPAATEADGKEGATDIIGLWAGAAVVTAAGEAAGDGDSDGLLAGASSIAGTGNLGANSGCGALFAGAGAVGGKPATGDSDLSWV